MDAVLSADEDAGLGLWGEEGVGGAAGTDAIVVCVVRKALALT